MEQTAETNKMMQKNQLQQQALLVCLNQMTNDFAHFNKTREDKANAERAFYSAYYKYDRKARKMRTKYNIRCRYTGSFLLDETLFEEIFEEIIDEEDKLIVKELIKSLSVCLEKFNTTHNINNKQPTIAIDAKQHVLALRSTCSSFSKGSLEVFKHTNKRDYLFKFQTGLKTILHMGSGPLYIRPIQVPWDYVIF